MNKNLLLLTLKISLLLSFIGLSACATSPPEATWEPVTMATTAPIHGAKKIYFVFDVSVENKDKALNKSLPDDSSTVQEWTAFASQMMKELKTAGVNADFILYTDKIGAEPDKIRNVRAPNDATHVVTLNEVRTMSRGRFVVNAWWVATVYQVNPGKKWDEKNQFEKISLYKYKFVGGTCFFLAVLIQVV